MNCLLSEDRIREEHCWKRGQNLDRVGTTSEFHMRMLWFNCIVYIWTSGFVSFHCSECPVSYCQSRFPATAFCSLAEKNSMITRCTNCNCACTFFASSLQTWYTVSNIDGLRACSSPKQKVVSDTGWGKASIPVLFLILIINTAILY